MSNNDCNNEVKEYYKNDAGTIYLVCADDFYIKNLMASDDRLTFNDYVGGTFQSFDDSIKK